MSQIHKAYTIGGKQLSVTKQIATKSEIIREEPITTCRAGALTTRTDDNTGIVTLTVVGAGADFAVADRVDLYWTGGYRRGMKVSSKVADAITIGTAAGDEGVGDNLPAATTVVQLAKSQVFDFKFDGSDAAILAFQVDARAIIVLTGDDDVEDYFMQFLAAGANGWDNESGEANPIAGDAITKVYISHNDTAKVRTIKVGVGLSS